MRALLLPAAFVCASIPGVAAAQADASRSCRGAMVFEDRVTPAFAERVREVSRRLRMSPDHLMAVMHYETAGTFRASIRNRHSRAVGLIQFLPTTARRLGTSSRALARMSPVRQLRWVERYLSPFRGRMRTIEDAYMAVFTPAGIGKRGSHVLYRRGQRSYGRNRGHDRNGDGRITVREVGTNARLRLERGRELLRRRCERSEVAAGAGPGAGVRSGGYPPRQARRCRPRGSRAPRRRCR